MWRILMIAGTGFFGLGAVAGLVLVGVSVFEGDGKTAAGVLAGAAVLAWVAYACRQDWRRENQRRNARSE